uniref:Defensin-like protein 1 isoform X1 n=1 Tax=Cicer arietinum TaxID=3827 RepID=A0A3Q7XTI4_CICAR|nr:defensin-like protein 1 isoform X1 [Cicer arietinum]
MERKPLGVLFTLFLLSAGVMVKIAEGRIGVNLQQRGICFYPSEKFTGVCMLDELCESICITEDFLYGNCGGLQWTCHCIGYC